MAFQRWVKRWLQVGFKVLGWVGDWVLVQRWVLERNWLAVKLGFKVLGWVGEDEEGTGRSNLPKRRDVAPSIDTP